MLKYGTSKLINMNFVILRSGQSNIPIVWKNTKRHNNKHVMQIETDVTTNIHLLFLYEYLNFLKK